MLLYEMLTGLPPYYDENTNEMYRKILSEPLHFPGPEIVPLPAKDLLTQLLDRRPEHRLGAKGPSEIKAHPFFNAIDWRKLLQRRYDPTFKPNVVRVALCCFQIQHANLGRRMHLIPPTSTVNSLKKRQPIRTLKGLCFHKPCNNNLQAGPTIVQLQVLAMPEGVSRILHLWEAYSSKSKAECRKT